MGKKKAVEAVEEELVLEIDEDIVEAVEAEPPPAEPTLSELADSVAGIIAAGQKAFEAANQRLQTLEGIAFGAANVGNKDLMTDAYEQLQAALKKYVTGTARFEEASN